MMIRSRCLLIFLAIAILSGFAPAQDDRPETPRLESPTPLSPDQLYEVALRHNPAHQQVLSTSGLTGINTLAAWGTLLPTLDVGYQISQNDYYQPTYVNPSGEVSTYPIIEETYQTVVDTINGHLFVGLDPDSIVTVVHPIPEGESRTSSGWVSLRETIRLGGQQIFGIRSANLAGDVNELSVAASAQDLYYSVRQSYYNVLAQKRLLDLANLVLEQRREQLRLAQARFEIGSVTELDVLQAEIDVGNQMNAIVSAENDLKVAHEVLNRVLGVDLQSTYELADSAAIFNPAFSLAGLIARSLQNRPDLQSADKQIQIQQNQVYSRRGEFLPDLSASLTHSRSENSGGNVDFTLNPRNRNTSMALSLSWNLFSGFADRAQYEQAQVGLNNARYDRKNQEQAVETEVRQAYYTLQETYERFLVTDKNRQLASRQLALEQERYRLGATSQLNLRVAQVTFEQAEGDHIANVFSFWSSLAALERAVGGKLDRQ